MTDSKKHFDDFLKKEEEKKNPVIDWEARKQEWINHLETLYKNISEWLEDYVASGKIKLEFSDYQLYEEALGSYNVRKLDIHLGNNIATLTPIGTFLIGARGRVDIKGMRNVIKLILVDKESKKPNISVRIVLSDEEEKKYQEEQKNKPKKEMNWTWKITTNPPNIKYTELDQDTFFESLIKVMNG